MVIIVDFQGFKSLNNEFIVKELAVLTTNEQLYEFNLFQLPCGLGELSPYLKKQVIWIE